MAAKADRVIYQMKISLADVRPSIWRRVFVPGDLFLDELHWVVQIAMGWTNSHLHRFAIKSTGESFVTRSRGERTFSDPRMELENAEDETRVRLATVAPNEKDRLRYDYDFGDGWKHHIFVEKILPRAPKMTYPRCVTGKRRCPPEDCGGPFGYAELLVALADPSHERHEELKEWLGDEKYDPDEFDAATVNAAMNDVMED